MPTVWWPLISLQESVTFGLISLLVRELAKSEIRNTFLIISEIKKPNHWPVTVLVTGQHCNLYISEGLTATYRLLKGLFAESMLNLSCQG